MEWSNDLIIEFLDLYEEEVVIWDPSNKKHKDRNEIHDAWKRIQEKFSVSHSLSELKKKRDSLMATYRKLLAKVKCSMRTGSGTEDKFKPEWFAFNKMAKFLHGIYTVRRTTHSEETSGSAYNEETDLSGHVLEESNEDPVMMNSSASCSQSFSEDTEIFKSPVAKKRKGEHKMVQIENRMEEAYNAFKNITAEPEPDECSLFAQLLAKKLRSFDEQTRETAMFEINSLMYRIRQSSLTKNYYSTVPGFYPSHQPSQHLQFQQPATGFSQSPISQTFIGIPPSPSTHSSPRQSPSPYLQQSSSQSSSTFSQPSPSQSPSLYSQTYLSMSPIPTQSSPNHSPSPFSQQLSSQAPLPCSQPPQSQSPSPLTQPSTSLSLQTESST